MEIENIIPILKEIGINENQFIEIFERDSSQIFFRG